jgi:hypothetical protein
MTKASYTSMAGDWEGEPRCAIAGRTPIPDIRPRETTHGSAEETRT